MVSLGGRVQILCNEMVKKWLGPVLQLTYTLHLYCHVLRSTLWVMFAKDLWVEIIIFWIFSMQCFYSHVRYMHSLSIMQSLLHSKQWYKIQGMGNFLQHYESLMGRLLWSESLPCLLNSLIQRRSMWFSYYCRRWFWVLRNWFECNKDCYSWRSVCIVHVYNNITKKKFRKLWKVA